MIVPVFKPISDSINISQSSTMLSTRGGFFIGIVMMICYPAESNERVLVSVNVNAQTSGE
jgi:hypothetical protein